jgi:hypothetical protein
VCDRFRVEDFVTLLTEFGRLDDLIQEGVVPTTPILVTIDTPGGRVALAIVATVRGWSQTTALSSPLAAQARTTLPDGREAELSAYEMIPESLLVVESTNCGRRRRPEQIFYKLGPGEHLQVIPRPDHITW